MHTSSYTGTATPERKTGKQRPGALDPNFPMLAASAAAELDALLFQPDEHHPDLSSIEALNELLASTAEINVAAGGKLSLWDPVSDDVLVHAVMESELQQGNISAESLMTTLKAVTANFGRLLQDPSQTEASLIAQTRDFCLALSNYSALKSRAAVGFTPRHPHRKIVML